MTRSPRSPSTCAAAAPCAAADTLIRRRELLTFGEYRELDLSEPSYGRFANRAPLIKCALI